MPQIESPPLQQTAGMKQVLQSLRTGAIELIDVPCPKVAPGHLLVQTRASLISAGTERSLVEFGRASLVGKARQHPDRVRQVVDKIRSDGLLPTLEAVFAKLDEPLPVGYCNAGVVVQAGEGVSAFSVGDRVSNNGPHAEMVHVPVNLSARIPDAVADDHASFAVLGAIGMQGIRLLRPELGETVAVFGLGLVGLLSVQMLVAAGVRVLGIDLDAGRLELAKRFGAEPINVAAGGDPTLAAQAACRGEGVDGVLITASAKNDDIVSQSARMCRKRGRIVLVGVVNLKLNRAEWYAKELSFQVSCSYGPGRYDPRYEEQGIDYPYPYVRWTEQRNIEAVLEMIAADRLAIEPLISSRIAQREAPRAYNLLAEDRSQLGIVLTYPADEAPLDRVVVRAASSAAAGSDKVVAGIIGAGMYTKRTLLPALKRADASLAAIASSSGTSAAHVAGKFDIAASTSDYRTILDDPRVNTIFITTRHNTHAALTVEALQAGKHVFVEKPLAIDREGLDDVRRAYENISGRQLMVGFNRRFSPHARKIKELMAARSQPACMAMTVNAGAIPPDHWLQDPRVGGGRILGEGCHWIDLLSFLVGAPIATVTAVSIGDAPGVTSRDDHVSITLSFSDGSIGTIHYFANGQQAFPKERLEIFCQGRVLQLDNFRRLRGYGWPGLKKMNLLRQDKGHQQEISEFVDRVGEGGTPLIPPDEIWNVTEATLAARQSAAEQSPISLNRYGSRIETDRPLE